MKSIGHKYLNNQNKNHSRCIIPSKTNHSHQIDQHGYQRKPKKIKIKDHQKHLQQKVSWAKKSRNFILQKEWENRTHPIHCLKGFVIV